MNNFIDLAISKIIEKENFSFVKRGDGEEACMNGDTGSNCDGHLYTIELNDKLVSSYKLFSTIPNVFVPRFEDQEYYNSLLHRTDSNVQKVRQLYRLIREDKRKKIFVGPERLGLVNTILKTNCQIAVPLDNCFNYYDEIVVSLKNEIIDDCIILFSCGMPAKPLIADCLKTNQNITCLDLGSAFDPLIGETRTYQISTQDIVELYKEYLPTIDILIPTLGRPEGLKRCLDSIETIIYPKEKINVIVREDEPRIGVSKRLNELFREGTGEWCIYGSNDIEFTPHSVLNALTHSIIYKLISFNTGQILPDKGNINEHFIINRQSVNDMLDGKIFDEDFGHVGVDNLLWRQYDKKGLAIRANDAIVHHYHFSNGGSEMDEIYSLGWMDVENDRETLSKKLEEIK